MHLVSHKLKCLLKPLLFSMMMLLVWQNISFAQTELSSSKESGKLKVLILNSYEPENPWTKVQEESIISSLTSQVSTTKLYREYMDSKRMYGDAYDNTYSEYLKNKYKNEKIQLIITTDDYATKFVRSYKNSFAQADTPVVFSGVNDLSFKDDNFVGVYERVNIEGTVDLIHKLQGEDEPILIVTDKTISSERIIEASLSDNKWLKDHNTSLLQSDDLGVLGPKVSAMREGAIIFLLFNEDSNGNQYSYYEGLAEIKKYTDLPIYVVWDFYMGQNVIGGACITQKAMADDINKIIGRLLNGEPINQLTSTTTEAVQVVDYDMLNKYGLLSAAESAKLEIINQPMSFWEEYAQLITLIFTLSFVFIVIIVLLINNIRQKNKYYDVVGEYKAEMQQTHQKLEKKLSESTQLIESLNSDQERYIRAIMDLKKRASLIDKLPLIFHDHNMILGGLHAAISELHGQSEKIIRNESRLSSETQLKEVEELVNEVCTTAEMQIQGIIQVTGAVRTCVNDLNTNQQRNYKPQSYIEAFWQIVKPTLKKRKVSITHRVADEVLIYGNPGDFITVLMILVGNGIKHGYVLSPERPLRIELEMYSNQSYTQLIYRDDGNGCPTEKLELGLNRKLDGTLLDTGGVGLYMLNQIVTEKFQGQIHVSGDVDEGVQIRITIPKAGEVQ